jgi:hypothetical protein
MTNQGNQGNPWRQRKSLRRDARTPSATIIAQINDIEDEYVVAPLPEPVLLSRATDPELGRILRQWSDAAVWVIGAAFIVFLAYHLLTGAWFVAVTVWTIGIAFFGVLTSMSAAMDDEVTE